MYAHTPNLRQRSRLPVFDNPEWFENRLLFSSDVAFTFRCKRWATALHFNLLARSTYKYLPILKRKIWDKNNLVSCELIQTRWTGVARCGSAAPGPVSKSGFTPRKGGCG